MNICISKTTIIYSILSLFLGTHYNLSAQSDTLSNISYQINRIQKYVSITPDQLENAQMLSELNHFYKSDWVKEYKSVNTIVIVNGKTQKLETDDNHISDSQKKLIQSADKGSDITVIVDYLPNNQLSSNSVQQMDFTFRVDPKFEAKYHGGKNNLDNYIATNILDKVTIKDIPQFQVAAVNFIVDENGQIIDAHITKGTENKTSDNIILRTVCDMPNWQSAEYSDGTKTKQEFVLTVGDHQSCTMNLLDIKSEVPPSTLTKK